MNGITPGTVLQESFGSSWFPSDQLGSFRLAYLETLLRAADAHASSLAK